MCVKNIHFLKSLYCRSQYLNNKQLSDVFHTYSMHCAFFSVMLASFIARMKYQRINSLFIVTSKYIFFRRGRHLTLLYMTFFTLKKMPTIQLIIHNGVLLDRVQIFIIRKIYYIPGVCGRKACRALNRVGFCLVMQV